MRQKQSPPERATVGLMLKVTPSVAERLDSYRMHERPLPSRASVLRWAMEDFLKRKEQAL